LRRFREPKPKPPTECPCAKGTNPFWVITCPVHGDPKIKERPPRRNEELNSVLRQIKRNNYQVISRGLPRLIAIHPKDGHPVFLWKRGWVTSYRGDPLKGLSRYQKFLYKIFKDTLKLDCEIL